MSSHTGYSVFTSQAPSRPAPVKISQYVFNKWKKLYTWTAVQDSVPYGQNFCEHFDIIDYQIYFTHDVEWINAHIQKYYIK